MITRRAVLLAAAAAGTAACSSSGRPAGVPDVRAGRLVSGSFTSRYRRARTGWSIAYPPGHSPGSRLPVLIALHGRGGDHRDNFGGDLHLDYFLADAVRHGTPPFAVASVDGGDHDYWHPRRGTDPAGMVLHEFRPLLAERGLDVRRVGFLGWSMGGYGALYLASTLTRTRCAVAVAESPAVWHQPGQSAAGAFDDAADFRAHDIFRRLDRLRGIALRIDCGDRDDFAPITRDLRAAISPRPAGGIEPGAHDGAYWRSQAPAQLRFAGVHLG